MKTFITAVAATLLSAAAIAGGDTDKSHTTASFEALDKNADQQISRTEAAAEKKLSENFVASDTNGDGYVNKAEYAAHAKAKS